MSFQIYGMCKKNCDNHKKTEWKSLVTHRRARCNLYSILFNLCGSPGFYHWCQNQRNQVRLFISTLRAEQKCIFRFVYTKLGRNWILEKWKKYWKSPGILFSLFRTNPGSLKVLLYFDVLIKWQFVTLSADAFFKAAISQIADVPRVMELDGKNRSSEPFLVDYISSFISTLLVVPVSRMDSWSAVA